MPVQDVEKFAFISSSASSMPHISMSMFSMPHDLYSPLRHVNKHEQCQIGVLLFQDTAGGSPSQQQALPEDDVDPELARYLNRSYWEQRQSEEAQQHEKQQHHSSDRNGGRVDSPLNQQPSAPMSSTTASNKLVSGNPSSVCISQHTRSVNTMHSFGQVLRFCCLPFQGFSKIVPKALY